MGFNTLAFWLFTAFVVPVLWLLPPRGRRVWLLAASYAFYAAWHPSYVLLLIVVGVLGCYGGRWVLQTPEVAVRRRRGAMVLTLLAVELGAFKYMDWAFGSVNGLAAVLGFPAPLPLPHWVLPLGVSFYTFEAMSYVVECMKGKEKPYGFFQFQLFIAFFPHLVAGPIMRAKDLVPQFETPPARLRATEAARALWYIATGLLMKGVLADRLAQHVDTAFARDVATLDARDVLVTAVGFGLQMYLDFAAYSRMAVGAAALCGVKLVENFNFPFRARTPADFWARWHISLSRWIRDYLYYPLLGKRLTLRAMCKATLISMALCGVWHGAGLSFIVWGLYHGVILAGYYVARSLVRKPPVDGAPPPSWLDTRAGILFGATCTWVVLLPSWILFRSPSLAHAGSMLATLFTPWSSPDAASSPISYRFVTLVMLGVWLAPFVRDTLMRTERTLEQTYPRFTASLLPGVRGVMAAVALVLASVSLDAQTTFIYFQF